MSVVLYSTDCPKCKVIKQKLIDKNINFQEVKDINIMKEKNITKVPVLDIGDGNLLEFVQANQWVNDQKSIDNNINLEKTNNESTMQNKNISKSSVLGEDNNNLEFV